MRGFTPQGRLYKAMAPGKREPFVLVVEDDEAVYEAIRSLLGSAGFRSVHYPSAEALLRSGRARAARCLIIDLRLPGMSGMELHRSLRELGAQVATILITAEPDPDGHLRSAALRAGIGAVLYKPFDADALVECVRKALGKRRS